MKSSLNKGGENQKMQTGMFKIDRIQSRQDVDKVLKALNGVWGVLDADVNPNNHEATFRYDEKAASEQDFEAAITEIGFEIRS
jgi:copper chaperone CopZ